jgi:two-component sensor histidine kinase
MALLIHELATNAAKYGAFSEAGGTLTVSWLVTDKTLRLAWRETGGPPIAPPADRGFGLQLLPRALEQFGGTANMTFETTGLVCMMSCLVS